VRPDGTDFPLPSLLDEIHPLGADRSCTGGSVGVVNVAHGACAGAGDACKRRYDGVHPLSGW